MSSYWSVVWHSAHLSKYVTTIQCMYIMDTSVAKVHYSIALVVIMAYCTFTLIKPREPYHILGGDTYQLYINIRAEQLIDLIINCDY